MTFPVRVVRAAGDLVRVGGAALSLVRKRSEQFDAEPGPPTGTAVYCFGTLEGEWLDGTAFSGIRFIDRFLTRDGQLADQRVWNDMAETRADAAPPE